MKEDDKIMMAVILCMIMGYCTIIGIAGFILSLLLMMAGLSAAVSKPVGFLVALLVIVLSTKKLIGE